MIRGSQSQNWNLSYIGNMRTEKNATAEAHDRKLVGKTMQLVNFSN